MSRSYYASCTLGLETTLTRELEALGADHLRPERGGVAFRGSSETGYAACMWLRTASRVQEQLFGNRPVPSREQLYDAVYGFDWAPLIGEDHTLAVHATLSESRATDARFVGLVVKDAIVDQLRKRRGRRPDVDPATPDVPIRVVVRHDRARVLRDLSGAALHRRGWRPVQVKSPLNEAVAAGLLQVAGWDGSQPLYDPMCGSGTFLVEAAHLARDRAPGLRRKFAFERWPDLDRRAWRRVTEDAEARYRAGKRRPLTIAGADHHPGALSIARRSLEAAGLTGSIELDQRTLDDTSPLPFVPQLVVSNPPWGRRLGADESEATWTSLGRFLKTHCAGATAWLLSGDAALTRALRMRAARRHPVTIAQVDARWIRYDVLPPRSKPEPATD